MKTIAVSMDESLIAAVDRIARETGGGSGRSRPAKRRPNRSGVIREAVRDYLSRREKHEREARERRILGQHRALLERQLEALVAEQAGQ